jgi:threonine dehydratase
MITSKDIQRAADRIREDILRTPLVYSPTFSTLFGGRVYLKLENLQKTGSFKIRGATNKIRTIRSRIGPRGVVAASAGNHAQGVALAASEAGVSATIVMPEGASISKQEATRSYGGEVVIHGKSVGESIEEARRLSAEGRVFIHPYDDPLIIAGQGTLGLEIADDLPEVDQVLVPVGGGGLISGVAVALTSRCPNARIIGVQASACPSAATALSTGKRRVVGTLGSIADGITVKQTGKAPFTIMRDRVETVVLVEEELIAAAILMLLEKKKILAEGAGAVPLAALMAGQVALAPGSSTVLVISGGNLDSPLLGKIISKGLSKSGRIIRIGVQLSDVPGALADLLGLIADADANVLHIYHDRRKPGLPINASAVELELETRGREHTESVITHLEMAGYPLTCC